MEEDGAGEEWLWCLLYIMAMLMNNGSGNERGGWCETRYMCPYFIERAFNEQRN